MTKEELAEKAVEYKHSGYNCAQAVAKTLSDEFGFDTENILKMTSGFAGGMGTMEATCGALIGANLIAGIKTAGSGTIMKSMALHRSFTELCGASICKDLKGRDTGVMKCSCDDCIRNAIQVYFNVMK